MQGGQGMNLLLGNFIRSFWTCRKEAVDPMVAMRMSYTILDLIAAAYSTGGWKSARERPRRRIAIRAGS